MVTTNRRIQTALGRSRPEMARQRVWIKWVLPFLLLCVAPTAIQMSDGPQFPRSIRTRPSMAGESGGEEILYPRQLSQLEQRPLQHIPTHELDQAPPSDSSGNTSRVEPVQSLTKDTAVRKHRSLGVGHPPGQKAKDRRRDTNLTPSKESGSTKGDRHSRHSSIGSSSSRDHGCRVHTTDAKYSACYITSLSLPMP
jgi:hypothetical protein